MYTYDDYMELKRFFLGLIKDGVPMDQEVMQVYWKDLKCMERETRCIDEHGNRCMKKCKECDHYRKGAALSLEQMIEEGSLPQDSVRVESYVEDKILLEALHNTLNLLDDIEYRVISLWMVGVSERQIGEAVGMSQKGVNYRKKKAIEKIQRNLKNMC